MRNKKETRKRSQRKNDFKLHLIQKIQKVFEDESNILVKNKKKLEDMTREEKIDYFGKKKQKILGNVNFIAQLYIEKFFVLAIVRICTTSLLQKFLKEYSQYVRDPASVEFPTHEDNLEGLVKFYEQIGKIIEEKEKAKEKPKSDKKEETAYEQFVKIFTQVNNIKVENFPEFANEEVSLDDFFKIMEYIRAKAKLSPRMQSLIVNNEYRRNSNWVVPEYRDKGPKSIKEIHQEYEREREESDRRDNEYYEDYQSYRSKHSASHYVKKEVPKYVQSDDTTPRSKETTPMKKE